MNFRGAISMLGHNNMSDKFHTRPVLFTAGASDCYLYVEVQDPGVGFYRTGGSLVGANQQWRYEHKNPKEYFRIVWHEFGDRHDSDATVIEL